VRIGDQTGGHVFLYLFADDFWRDYKDNSSKGVVLDRGKEEVYGTVAFFLDISGNMRDLIQPAD